jgi:hypothetical protein
LPDSRARPQIWPPVGANQSQCPAPLGQRTVLSRFGCVTTRRKFDCSPVVASTARRCPMGDQGELRRPTQCCHSARMTRACSLDAPLMLLAPLFFLCRFRGLFLFGASGSGALLMDAFFSATLSRPTLEGPLAWVVPALGELVCHGGICARFFRRRHTRAWPRVAPGTKKPGPLNRASCMPQLNTRAVLVSSPNRPSRCRRPRLVASPMQSAPKSSTSFQPMLGRVRRR